MSRERWGGREKEADSDKGKQEKDRINLERGDEQREMGREGERSRQ